MVQMQKEILPGTSEIWDKSKSGFAAHNCAGIQNIGIAAVVLKSIRHQLAYVDLFRPHECCGIRLQSGIFFPSGYIIVYSLFLFSRLIILTAKPLETFHSGRLKQRSCAFTSHVISSPFTTIAICATMCLKLL